MSSLYGPLLPSVYLARHELEIALIRWITSARIFPVAEKTVLEIGCGGGGSLRALLRLGFLPEHLTGNELLAERVERARRDLPPSVQIIEGDALALRLPPRSFDIVMQSTVFSSILDDDFQTRLAAAVWDFVKPGGGVLWYDFAYDNPRNPDVRGVRRQRIQSLFPLGKVTSWRVTLAPPISRSVTKIHPSLYGVLNALPFLRTHLLCWVQRPLAQD